MYKKRLMQVFVTFLVIIISVFLIVIFNKNKVIIHDIKVPNDTGHSNQVKYKELFDIKYNCNIEKSKTSESNSYEEGSDLKTSNFIYKIDIINKTDHEVNIGNFVHIPQVLCDKGIVLSEESRDTSFLTEDTKTKAGSSVGISYYSFAKNYEFLTDEEKKIFDEFKDTLYLEIYIDGYIFYVKASPKGYDIISEQEFIKKAGPFLNGRLKDELKKVYRLKYKEN